MGVSPLVDWAGVLPAHRDTVELEEGVTVTKEPSVRFRGFFINDEWPAYGNFTTHNFGGFNAKMYEHVFELLLRLKGNYLWPAMWSAARVSSFLPMPGHSGQRKSDDEESRDQNNSHF